MRSELEGVRSNLQRAKETSIAHEELGVANSFQAAEKAKNDTMDFALATLDLLDQVYEKLPQTLRENYSTTVASTVGRVFREAAVNQVVNDGIHQPQFPSRRSGEIQATLGEATTLFTLLGPIQAHLMSLAVESQLQDPAFHAARQEFENSLIHVRSVVSDVDKAKVALESASMQRVVERSSGGFEKLRNQHKTVESRWFKVFLVMAAVTAVAVSWAVTTGIDADSPAKVVAKVFERVLAISTAAVFARVALVKYNLERNLRIIYDHRATVLAQYQVFENAISEKQEEAKNRLRLEVARVVFSDPRTGYADFGPASEFSVNPVVHMAETMVDKKP